MQKPVAFLADMGSEVDSLVGDSVRGIVPRTEHQVRVRDDVSEMLTEAGRDASIPPDVLVPAARSRPK